MYLDILIEDCQSWEETLAYLQSLPRQEAAAALQKYGKARLLIACQRWECLHAVLYGDWWGPLYGRSDLLYLAYCRCWSHSGLRPPLRF